MTNSRSMRTTYVSSSRVVDVKTTVGGTLRVPSSYNDHVVLQKKEHGIAEALSRNWGNGSGGLVAIGTRRGEYDEIRNSFR
ncbi:unnamed protein product [Linum trigynum]|uniref:Uncharacterized protein n=1 Tax=Linum trigynum TaxID=586398 RepID=A0AAV2CZH2_9ROSI